MQILLYLVSYLAGVNWYNPNVYPSSNSYLVPVSAGPGQSMPSMAPQFIVRRKDLLWSSHGRVNLGAAQSFAPNGSDLPSRYL